MDRYTIKNSDGYNAVHNDNCYEDLGENCCGPAIDRLAAYEDTGLMPEQVTEQRWIPVTERLPAMETKTYNDGMEIGNYEISDIVLGYATDGTNGYAVTVRCERDHPGEIFWAEDCGTCHEITHWMALPEPPKKGE